MECLIMDKLPITNGYNIWMMNKQLNNFAFGSIFLWITLMKCEDVVLSLLFTVDYASGNPKMVKILHPDNNVCNKSMLIPY